MDQRVEAGVLRDDVKVRSRIGRCELAYVKSDVKVESVGTVPHDLDVLRPGSESLHRASDVEEDLVLSRADENDDLKVLLIEHCHRIGLDILEVYEDVICANAHGRLWKCELRFATGEHVAGGTISYCA